MNSILETQETMTVESVINAADLGASTRRTNNKHDEQRRGSTPAVMVGGGAATNGGHKKLCRVVHGQRVILGTTPPVFVAELRPSASSELLTSSQTPPKSRSPLNVEIDETNMILSANMISVKLLEAQDSDPCYTSGSEHSALSRNTSEASETLSQECAYSPTLTTTTASTNGPIDIFANSRSPVNATPAAVHSSTSYEFGQSDFSKLTLQDSGYSGSFPLCATNSDAALSVSNSMSILGCGISPQSIVDTISPDYYASLLEFTLKLGYSEGQLRSVLCKLGTANPGQDKVLAELIKLGQDVQDVVVVSSSSASSTAEHAGGTGPASSHGNPSSGSQQWTTTSTTTAGGLRSIVIDGSNVAMTHGNKVVFSCLGIRMCVDWFRRRGHTDIKVFVPQFRKEQSRSDNPITDQHILFDLEKENVLVWTPSRRLGGRRIICHDDRYILKTAVEKEAVVVSNDEYRDMVHENPEFRKAVEERLLMYNFIDDKFVVPDDPLGRYGPRLDQLLSKSSPNSSAPPCPYGRKCTYGNKCKFYHPERLGGLHRSVTERLRDHAELHRRISPTNSLQHGRLGATDSFGDLSAAAYATKGGEHGQKPMAFRTQSLNPATLLRQSSNSSTTSAGRYSPPSLAPQSYHHNLLLAQQSSLGHQQSSPDRRKYHPHYQRLQAESGHAGLSKQMSNPEAARKYSAQGQQLGAISDDSRYHHLMPPGQPPPPNSLLRQIWQTENYHGNVHGGENHLHPHHQPVMRNMSAPGVNLLRNQAQFSCAPPMAHHHQHHQNAAPAMYPGGQLFVHDQRKNSVSDSQLNLLGASGSTSVDNDDAFDPLSPPLFAAGGSNYYIPSTTVWGPVEHSSSPVFTSAGGWPTSSSSTFASAPHASTGGNGSKPAQVAGVAPTATSSSFEGTRSKVYYHLSQLFPENLVNWVMRANPNETDPQKLCSLILTAREQNKNCGDNEN